MKQHLILAVAAMVAIAGVFVTLSSQDADVSPVDTSDYAGDYYAQKDDGTWFKAITIGSDGTGTAYKAYRTIRIQGPKVPQRNRSPLTSIADGMHR